MINVYDNIISEDMHKKVYQWGQTVPWYCHWIGLNASPHYSDRELIPSLNLSKSSNDVFSTIISLSLIF